MAFENWVLLGVSNMWKRFWAISILAAGMVSNHSSAVSQDVLFNGTVTHTCSITVTQDGTLDPRSDFTRLTSRSGPGIPGRADVTATGNTFMVSVEAPTAFNSKPAIDTTPETFRAWHRSNGATYYTATQTPMPINVDLSRVRVHMDARRSGSDVFE